MDRLSLGGPASLAEVSTRQRSSARSWIGTLVGAFALVLACLLVPVAELGAQTMDDHIYTYVAFDELEWAPGASERPVEYDGEMWVGGDYDRLWLKADGEQSTLEAEGHFEFQALYSRATTPFWNVQAGLGVERRYGPVGSGTRGLVTMGIQGLAPYWFHSEAFVVVSHEGDVSARLEAAYDILFTQRLVLEPEIELSASVQDVPEWGIGSGLSDMELGARLRYEIVREFAPYVGISWTRRFGDTADLARAAGGSVSEANFVAGLKWWY
ncbi:MAG: copper resistance protein B [Longimicrobiales bacterium]|nr:copper resistance protein B [Longimicrobiales bacterium]